MRLGDEPESGNFIDRTGSTGGGGLGFGGGGGNLLGCLLPLVLSRFGIVGVVILLLGYCALSSIGGGGGLGGILPSGGGSSTSAPSGQSTIDPNTKALLVHTLGSTDQVWGQIFAKNGSKYVEPSMVAYTSYDQSGCGAAQAAMGPFYCPTDKRIYIDPTFFNELSQRFGAPGDFAQAYVIAHEVGHHVQDLQGILDSSQRQQSGLSETAGNRIQVGIELQADCYAGVWAANARDDQGRSIIQPGDVEEGMKAAEAIGDDTLQRQAQGVVVPESFTHGTSAQRMQALHAGLDSGNPAACAVYTQGGY
jgi:predicted metalloprotease